ncbi:SOS response-associated peptidase family protein [Companilactobacillus furfuricola]|uniref:SOS response-associated peptidase family protein n=1 Tax=Companilactobacillus furfuricola TaxID=1462575 RepID=UPI000F787117|nr:SOS response-associated peptidase family protein [Companilactobacillus furfuricola]
MCGRFMFEPKENPEIERIYQLALDDGFDPKTGEIFPTDETALIVAGDTQVRVVTMKWGFPGFKSGQSIINARSETAYQKPMFAQSIRQRRCVYPTTGFFEWNKGRQKFRFNYGSTADTLFIAGCYNLFDGSPQSVLFTTKPNESMIQIHDRMPLILSKKQINAWIYDDDFAQQFISSTMPQLTSTAVNKD